MSTRPPGGLSRRGTLQTAGAWSLSSAGLLVACARTPVTDQLSGDVSPPTGQAMRVAHKPEGVEEEAISQPRLEAKNQFALELDHLADCIFKDRKPHTPGEEGLQDMKLIAAIYEAAASGTTVKLPATPALDQFRGPLAS